MRLIRIVLIGLWISLLWLSIPGLASTVSASRRFQRKTEESGFRSGRLIVGWEESGQSRVMAMPGITVEKTNPELAKINVATIEVPPGEETLYRDRFKEIPGVSFVELDYPVTVEMIPDDTRWVDQYGPGDIGAPAAWDITTGSSDVIIAVLDSGIEAAHSEFSGRLVSGYDMVSRDSEPEDLCGHGTHVAGIAAASGNNLAGIAGIAWGTRIMPVRVLDDFCSGWTSDVAAGVIYAVDHGADVINMSLGVSLSTNLLEYATHYAYENGVTLVAAAGNSSSSVLSYPARYPWVLAVGSVNSSRTRALTSNGSNDPADLLVMAPGVQILSTSPYGETYYEGYMGLTRQYGTLSGTSMAAPHAAGAAALLASLPAFDTPDKIYEALYRTTIDLGPTGWDLGTGYGLIQIDQALAFDDFTLPPPPPDVTVVYDQVTSEQCAGLSYNWIDARLGGEPLPVFGTDAWANVSLPFDFSFGGTSYDRVAVSANGFLTFDLPASSTTPRDNFLIPWIGTPNQFIAPFWDDLNPSAGGMIYALDLGDRFVVEWWQVPRQGLSASESSLTFEVVLYRDSGNILFQYHSLVGPASTGSSATVGLEYADGNAGSQYSYNRPVLQPGLAILYAPAEPGSTRSVLGCLFTTSSDFTGCNQTPTFGVEIPTEILPDNPSDTILTIRALQNAPETGGGVRALGKYADIVMEPMPVTPFNPPALVCYHYTPADLLLAGGRVSNLYLAVYNSTSRRWDRLPTVASTSEPRLSAVVPHFSLFGVFTDVPARMPVTGAAFPTWVWLPGLVALISWVMLLRLKERE